MALTWIKISCVECLANGVPVSLSRSRSCGTRNKHISAIDIKHWQCSIFLCSLQFCLLIAVAMHAGYLPNSCHNDTAVLTSLRYQKVSEVSSQLWVKTQYPLRNKVCAIPRLYSWHDHLGECLLKKSRKITKKSKQKHLNNLRCTH